MRGVPTGRWSNPFSESSVEEKVCAVGPHEVFSDSSEEGLHAGHGREVRKASCLTVSSSNIGGLDVFSDFSNEGDSGQKMGIGGNEVFSDSEIEAENEELTAARTGYGSAAGALFPFSDSDIEADNEVTLSDSTTGALFPFSDSESEADNGEVTAASLRDISQVVLRRPLFHFRTRRSSLTQRMRMTVRRSHQQSLAGSRPLCLLSLSLSPG